MLEEEDEIDKVGETFEETGGDYVPSEHGGRADYSGNDQYKGSVATLQEF